MKQNKKDKRASFTQLVPRDVISPRDMSVYKYTELLTIKLRQKYMPQMVDTCRTPSR